MSVVTVVPFDIRSVSGSQNLNGWSPNLPISLQVTTGNFSGVGTQIASLVLEASLDGGVSWSSIGDSLNPVSPNSIYRRVFAPSDSHIFSDLLRVRWTVVGTNPQVEFAVFMHSKP